MKTRTILIISALVALTGCGNAAHWGSSSSSQRFEDGIYRKVETVNRETRDSIRFETDALASKTRETQLYLKKGQSDTIFVPENKAAHIVLQDNYNALTIPTETITLSPWYYSTTWAYGMYRPWFGIPGIGDPGIGTPGTPGTPGTGLPGIGIPGTRPGTPPGTAPSITAGIPRTTLVGMAAGMAAGMADMAAGTSPTDRATAPWDTAVQQPPGVAHR